MGESHLPEGYRTVTPYLALHGLGELLEFVQAVSDPAGNQWWLATRKETLTHEEIAERMSGSDAD